MCDVQAQEQKESNDSVKFVFSRYERSNPKKAAIEYYMRGKQVAVTTGNNELAANYYMRAIKANPEHAAANFELAMLLSPEKALDYSLKANEIEKDNYWFAEQLAEIYMRLNRHSEGLREAERVVKINPKSEKAYQTLSTYHYYNRDIERAFNYIDTLKSRFGMSPESAFMHTNMIVSLNAPTEEMIDKIVEYSTLFDYMSHFSYSLGTIYMRQNRVEDAINSFKQARATDAEDYRSSIALFEIFLNMNNQGEAIKYLGSVLSSPDMTAEKKIELYKNMVSTNLYLYRNFYNYVVEASEALIASLPTNPMAINVYNKHLINIGEVEKALKLSIEAIDSGIVDIDIMKLIIEIYIHQKQYNEAYNYIDKAKELIPESNRDIEMLLLYALTEENKYKEAIVVVKREIKTLETDSLRSAYWGMLGDIYHSMGKDGSSFKSYDKSLKYNPDNVVVLNNYSYYLSEKNKRLVKALEMSLKAKNAEPSNATYIDTYAWILYKLERYYEAREVIAKAVALDTSGSVTLFMHYGDILDKLGERDLAEMYWQKALENGADAAEIEKRLGRNNVSQ